MNAAISMASSAPAFYLFKSPLITALPFEIWRKIGNTLALRYYNYGYEPNYTEEGFDRAIKAGISSCANAIVQGDQQKLRFLLSTTATEYVNKRVEEIPPEIIKDRLSFTSDNIVSWFGHSYVFSSDRIIGFRDKDRPTFYATIVAYIDKNSTERSTIKQAQQRLISDNLLVCNITYARIIDPLGKWRITDVNFFDGKFITQ